MNIKKMLKNMGDPKERAIYAKKLLEKLGYYNSWEDEKYLKLMYRLYMGKELDLENPRTFNEKLQWLKLHDRKPLYTTMVDKYAVKQYVAERIGEEYIIPTLGIWNSFDEIDFSKLPDQFVLKCTHDSGGLVICRDKARLDMAAARKMISKTLKRRYYLAGREWPYKDVKPRVIAEKYMEDAGHPGHGLRDYKFYCFDGKPRFLYLAEGLENHDTAKRCFVNMDWTSAGFTKKGYKPFSELPEKPAGFEQMKALAAELSKGMTFLRVDFYEINGKVYFGELTFYPASGFCGFDPDEWDNILGDWIKLRIS